ncbi:UNVERIFIED_CONTAM: hypothetical protein NCL1_16997 [Trichonephila clavipes]
MLLNPKQKIYLEHIVDNNSLKLLFIYSPKITEFYAIPSVKFLPILLVMKAEEIIISLVSLAIPFLLRWFDSPGYLSCFSYSHKNLINQSLLSFCAEQNMLCFVFTLSRDQVTINFIKLENRTYQNKKSKIR